MKITDRSTTVERDFLFPYLRRNSRCRYSFGGPGGSPVYRQPTFLFESNIIGTFELLEAARAYPPAHMLLASTSSAYGANTAMPYEGRAKADRQMSFMRQKIDGSMAHSMHTSMTANNQTRFLRFMVMRRLMWPCSSLQKQFSMMTLLTFTTMGI